jgi:predicted cupin superfamily sugar epimerase
VSEALRQISERAAALIERLALEPHPEGGYFKEIHCSGTSVDPLDGRPHRPASTTIHYMLVAGQHSRWHRVSSDEIWHFYEGDPLELFVAPPSVADVQRVVLGPAADSSRPTHSVPAGSWQAARPRGAYALVGCTVAPGFDFADFVLLRDDPAACTALERLHSQLLSLV